jgi:hypothetical protein
VCTVEVRIPGNVRRFSIEQDALVVLGVESKRVAMFTEPVNVGVLRQLGAETNILLLEN